MITNLKKNLNLSYQHIYMFTRRKCKDIIEKNRRKERSNMKSFKLRCKKLCAVVLMIVTAFGFSFAAPKTAKAANTKYWIKVNKRANVAVMDSIVQGSMEESSSILYGIIRKIREHSQRYSLINLGRRHLMDVSDYQ